MASRRKRICKGSISIRTTVYPQTFSPSFYWILGVFVVIIVMSDALSNTASSTTSPLSARNRHHKERWLVVDFDGTCTIRDTTPLLPRLAYLIESRSRHSTCVDCEEEEYATLEERLSIFSELENEYHIRYRDVYQSIDLEKLNTNDDTENRLQLESILNRFDCVSNDITARLSKSEILKGLGSISYRSLFQMIQSHQQTQEQNENKNHKNDETIFEENLSYSLRLRPNCLSILRRHTQNSDTSNNSWNIGVLSINWCPTLIKATLLHSQCERSICTTSTVPDEDNQTLSLLEGTPVWSNKIDGNGHVALLVPGAVAKKERILKLQNPNQENQQNLTDRNFVVYVGDSSTDLLALVQADVGVLIHGSSSTIGLATKFGITIRSINDYYDESDKFERDIIWTASNWDEIGLFLNRINDRLG